MNQAGTSQPPDAAPRRSRWTPRISLRTRLTAWVLAIFAVIQLTLGGIVFLYQQSSINGFFEERLSLRTREIASKITQRRGPPTEADLTRIAAEQLQFFLLERLVLTVYDVQGGLIASTVSPAPHIPAALLAGAVESQGVVLRQGPLNTILTGEDSAAPGRFAAFHYRGQAGSQYVLLVVTGDEYAQGMLRRVSQVIVTTAPIGLIAAGVAGWCIAGIAVAPLRELRSLARRLSPESIGEPMEQTARDPEFARLERDLDDARARMANALAAQERFMSNVSHELKTPISVVLMESQTLDLRDTPEPMRRYVASVREEMQRLGRLVNSFLTLTRVREGRSQTVSRSVMINELMLESVDHCRAMARQYSVGLRVALMEDPADVDLTVRGDPDLMRTMLDNLVRNAIRFSPANGQVHIGAARDNGFVRVGVRDWGAGIPQNMLSRIFDRFAQAASEERRGRGHGLGLEIAQGVAELHGGGIAVRNCDDGGCEFVITLPVADQNRRR
ncbi:MAG: hypothetical protein IBJ10_03240 [Phycisphaerales bacterium]|nr:hypothetical protein [Phycisphaerales bacterium]